MDDVPFHARFQCDAIESGFEFIVLGLENLTDNPTPRRRKHAIQNLSLGAATLLRERLRQEHWTLVFAEPAKADKALYDAGDFEPVGLVGALDRLEKACGLEVDAAWRWGVENLARRMTRMVSRGVVEATPTLAAVAHAAVSPFIESVPAGRRTPALEGLLERARVKLGVLEDYIRQARLRIGSQHLGERLLPCPNCRLDGTLLVDDGPVCLFCGYSGKPEQMADEYLGAFFPDDPNRFIFICPTCHRDSLVDAGGAEEDPWYKCLACGQSWGMDDLVFCAICGQPFEPPEGDPDEELCEVCRERDK